ncbi:MAG: flagellar biosynthesis anti-sigma factor FlgM [Pontibacterium sp.]
MVIDFTGLSSSPMTNARGKAAETTHTAVNGKESGTRDNIPSSPGDTVKLSDTAKALLRAEQSDANIPDVDSERVEQLKAEIENGTYQINSQKVAEGMLRFDKLLG